MSTAARTLLDKIWDAHQVQAESESMPGILYVDLHLIHEVTSPQAFTELRNRGLKLRHPGRILDTLDHSTPTTAADDLGQQGCRTSRPTRTQLHGIWRSIARVEQRAPRHRACNGA